MVEYLRSANLEFRAKTSKLERWIRSFPFLGPKCQLIEQRGPLDRYLELQEVPQIFNIRFIWLFQNKNKNFKYNSPLTKQLHIKECSLVPLLCQSCTYRYVPSFPPPLFPYYIYLLVSHHYDNRHYYTIIKGWDGHDGKWEIISELLSFALFCTSELTTKVKVDSMAEIAAALDAR